MTIDTSYEEKKNIKSSSLSQVDVILDGVDNDDWEDIAVNVEVRNSNPFKLHRQLQLGKGRGGICPSRQCRRQCKIFASGVNFSTFTHFLCYFLLKLLKLGEIDGVKFLA